MRGVTSTAERVSADEVGQFAATVAGIASRHSQADPWTPGAAVSDANPALEDALRQAGWDELGRDESLLPLAAPAAAALGRAFASLAPVDALLGGALTVGEMARYAAADRVTVEPRAGALVTGRAETVDVVPYTDALHVAAVNVSGAHVLPGDEAVVRFAAWVAASTGYLAGMSEEALRLALEHARSRRAFGGSLSALEPVQQMLADAATLVDGLTLLTLDCPGMDALAHAGDATERAVGICMQVTGALGFTMEFPLQRAYRRSRSARAWNEAVLRAWEEPSG
jgi:3-oxo-4-pregnene-20-carboxyl-CoA dehydrogenase alpha subunit